MATIATAGVKIKADDADLQKTLRDAEKSINRFGNQTKSVANAARNAFLGLTAALGSGALAGRIVETTKAFEGLQVSLETVFGSAEKAAFQFNRINAFASKTPFTIQQLTEATIKLKGAGLDPSIDALRSLGSTASALNKPLMQVTEALVDAAVGEFERLKELNIAAKSQGDRVAFTFNNITTEVGKNAAEIQEYLLSIGNTQFAGAIEKQSETLAGVFSTLEGAVDNLIVKFADESGLTGALKEAAKGMTEFFNSITQGRPTLAGLEADLARLEKGPTRRRRITAGAEQRAAEDSARLEQIKQIRLEIDKIKAQGGDLEAAERAINTIDQEIENLKGTLKGGPLTTGNRGQFKTEEGRTVGRIETLEAELDLLKELQTMSQEAADASSGAGDTKKSVTGVPFQMDEGFLELLQTEREALQEHFTSKQADLESALQNQLISEEQYHKESQNNRLKYLKGIEKIEKENNKKTKTWDEMTAKERRTVSKNFFGQMTALTASGSRGLFEIGKAASLANATLNAYESITAAFKYGAAIGGPPLGAAFAAAAGAAQFATIASLKNTQFGGGGGGGIPAATSAPSDNVVTPPSLPAVDELAANDEEIGTKTVTINVQGLEDGALVSKETIRAIVDQINEEENANVRIVL